MHDVTRATAAMVKHSSRHTFYVVRMESQHAQIGCASFQELGRTLLGNHVPTAWSELWPGIDEPLAYCAATAQRGTSVAAWAANMLTGTLWIGPLNIAQLFNPGQQ